MLDHIGIGVTDYEKAKAFYDLALAPLGMHKGDGSHGARDRIPRPLVTVRRDRFSGSVGGTGRAGACRFHACQDRVDGWTRFTKRRWRQAAGTMARPA